MKKWMATFAAVAVVCTVAPQAEANETIEQDGIMYEIFVADNGNKEARITGRTYNTTVVALPDKINGILVTEIGDHALPLASPLDEGGDIPLLIKKLPAQLKKVGDRGLATAQFEPHITLPETLKELGDSALLGVSTEQNFVIPKNIEVIGKSVFKGREFPNGLVIPETVKFVGEHAFYGAKTTHLVIPNTIDTIAKDAFKNIYVSESAKFPAAFTAMHISVRTNNSSLPIQLTGDNTTKRHDSLLYESFIADGAQQVRIVGYDAFTAGDTITVPETIDGMPVTEIGDSAFSTQIVMPDRSVKEVRLPETIRKIGDYAFAYDFAYDANIMASPVKVDVTTIPNVEEIGDNAFAGSAAFNSQPFVLPKTLHTIGDNAFSGANITDVHIGKEHTNIGEHAFHNSGLQRVTVEEGVTHIAAKLFSDNSIREVSLPSTLVEIGEHAFAQNQITSLTLGDNVTHIGSEAFMNNALTSVSMPPKMKKIGERAFANNKIENIHVPYVEDMGEAVYEHNGSTTVTFEEGITHIPSSTFSNGTITHITLPTTIEHIGAYAFSSNALTDVHIPKNVTFGAAPFSGNTIRRVTFEEGITTIPADLLDNTALTTVTIPTTVTHIEAGAFKNNQLTNITLPDSITHIGEGAFENNRLTSISFSESITHIGGKAFSQNELTTVTMPNTVTHIGEGAFENNRLTSISFSESITHIGSKAFYSNELTTVTIPPLVTTIASEAFSNNKLTHVKMYDNVKIIEEYAFLSNNSLEHVTWSKQLEEIKEGAFIDTNLKRISLPASLKVIGAEAFRNYNVVSGSLQEVHLASVERIEEKAFFNNSIHTLTLPNNLKYIGRSAFGVNALTTVTLPPSLEKIEDYAFDANKLTNVSIPASVSELSLNVLAANPLISVTLEGSNTIVYGNREQWTEVPNELKEPLKGIYTNASLTIPYENIGKPNGKPQTLYMAWQKEAKFKDIEGHWAQGAIESFTDKGYINGYPDGTFKPGAPIQRKHVARILNDVFKFEATQTVADFKDVPKNHPYYAAISAVQQAGIFSGDGGKFQPEANLTRGQLAKVLVLAAGFEPGGKSTFKDTPDTYWGTPYVSALADLAIVKGTDGFFNPQKSITRAQFVSMTSLALEEMERRAKE